MKAFPKITFVLYIIILLWIILFKLSLDLSSALGHQTGLNIIPFADVALNDLNETTFNIFIFIPFGLLLAANVKKASFGQKLMYAVIFSLAAEVIQFVWAIGMADITDVITNSFGAFCGLVLYKLFSNYVYDRELDRAIAAVIICLIALVVGILFSGTVKFQASPHDKNMGRSSQIKNANLAWPLTGQAAMGTVESGLLAQSSQAENPQPTASMAKIITALAIMEKQPLHPGQAGPLYTLTQEDVAYYHAHAASGGSVVPVSEGTMLTQYEAMQAMLIASGNNIADTLVTKVFGSEEAYLSYAQSMVQRMGLNQTVIADASGFNPNTVSTPSELVTIGIAAIKHPVIAEIVAQRHAWIPGIGTVKNTNELLGVDGIIGMKTGTTNEAGSCLLFAANHLTGKGQTATFVGAIMGDINADSLFSNTQKLLASAKELLNN